MSKARAIILSVTVEGLSQAETARRYQVSKGWVSKLVSRHRTHGEAAFEPRSRRPHSSPTRVADVVDKLVVSLRTDLSEQGLDAGPETIRWHLEHHHDVTVSTSTIRRRLLAAGLVVPEPKKRPRSSYTRFTADLPNECWQSDFTHWRLADGADTEILSWLDDHSRYALSVTAHQPVTGTVVVTTFGQALATHGVPASVLTDNALVYTTRFAGGRGGRNHLETHLADLGIHQKHSAPNHPTTCGKVERFQQTMKLWLRAQPAARHLDELNQHLTTWTRIYNHERPHRSLDRTTPAAAYQRLPKATPTRSHAETHHRLRHDRINTNGTITLRRAGRMHHIGIGRAHAGQPVIVLIDDLDTRIIDPATGELLRHLTLDPTRSYQPQNPT